MAGQVVDISPVNGFATQLTIDHSPICFAVT